MTTDASRTPVPCIRAIGRCIATVSLGLLSLGAHAITVAGRVAGEFQTTATGAAAYSIPIQVAAGMGGMKPGIALSYHSQAGDGMAGMGWTLTGFPRITRCPLTRAVDGKVQGVRFGSQDRFCLDGQPLVLISGTYGGNGAEYRLETHGHERIFSWGRQGTGPAWFELRQPDGLVQRFGNDADSRIEAPGRSDVLAWALNDIEDRFQQHIGFGYTEDSVQGEFYPTEVRWTYAGSETPQQARLRLAFDWEARPAQDVRDGFLWGVPWRSSVRLSAIKYEADTGLGLQLVHRYALAYATSGPDDSQRSRLSSVTQCGPSECLPPTTFTWDERSTQRLTATSDGPPFPSAIPGDFNGDGATDLYAATGGVWSVWPADPQSGGFLAPVRVGQTAASFNVGLPLDFNGDGLTDLLAAGADGFTAMLFEAPAKPGDPFTFRSLGDVSPAAMEVQPLDVDGDGLDDLVYLRNGMAYLRRNLGGSLGAEQPTGIRAVGTPYAAFQEGSGFIEPADFDGDGRQDMLVARSTESASGQYRWEAFLSTGSGYATDPIASFLTQAAPRKVFIADVNGDGLTDVLRHADGAWRTYLSRGTAVGSTPGLVAVTCATAVAQDAGTTGTVLDYDGDGRSDLLLEYSGVWRIYTPGNGCFDPQRYLEVRQPMRSAVTSVMAGDANGDGNADLLFALTQVPRWTTSLYQPAERDDHSGLAYRADLLQRVSDGLGNFHLVNYQPLTGWSGYQPTGSAPANTRLLRGGPTIVVSHFTANTGTREGSYFVTLDYASALHDRLGRGFLGFGRISAMDSRSGLTTDTTYRQDFPYTGRVDEVTVRSSNKRLSYYDAQWADATTTAPDPAGDVHFIHLSGDVQDSHEVDAGGGYAGSLVRKVARTLSWNHAHGAVSSEQTTVTAPQQPGISYRTTRAASFDESLRSSAGCLGFPSRVDITREISGSAAETRTVQHTWHLATCRPATQLEGPVADATRQRRTTYSYDASGRLDSTIAQDGAGQLAARQTRLGYDLTSYQPITESALISTEPDLSVSHRWNDAFGLVTSRVSPQGLTTTWAYDDFGRVRSETRSPGSTQFSYTACGPCFVAEARYVVREARSDGAWSETQHDGFGRIVARSSVLGDGRVSRQLIEYDKLGRVSRESAPFIEGAASVYWTTYAYDLLGRPRVIDQPISETAPSGATRSFTYAGLETTVRDAEMRAAVLTNDAENRLVSLRDPLNGTTTYSYTPFGQLTLVQDAGLHRRGLRYDERGLLTESNDPDAGRRQFTYNAFGELVSQTDARTPATVVSWQHDQLGRIRQRTEPEGTTTWTYASTAGSSRGLLTQVTGPSESGPTGFKETYAYDGKARLQRTTTTIDGSSYQTNYSYDGENKLKTMTYPTTVGWRPRFVFGYAYGHLNAISQDNAGLTPVYALLAMDAGSRETQASLGYDDVREVSEFDSASGRLKAIRTGTPAAPALYQNYAYEWDRVGNLLMRRDAGASPQQTERFDYDALNRLTRVSLNDATTLTMTYSADGNIRSKSDVGNFAYATDGVRPHAVTAVGGGPAGILGFDYDANGNMTQRSGNAITWTSFNLPRQINTWSDYARFTYGPGRNRIRQEVKSGSSLKTVHYVGPHFEVEIQGSTRRFRSNVFAYGRAVFSQVETTPGGLEAYYLLHDHQGSVDRLLRAAGTGANTLVHSFDAWGKRRNSNWSEDTAGQRYADAHWTERGYTGHEHLDGSRLVHMNGRLQDPALGRMLSPDPVMGGLANPQALNSYSYVANGPLSYVDPSGYFLSKLRKGLKRAVRHAGSFGRRVIRRWGRQIAAAVAAYYTAGTVSSWAYAAQTSSLAGGTLAAEGIVAGSTLSAAYTSSVIGGMAGGAVAGAIAGGDLRSTLSGALSGGAMGGIAGHFGGAYSAGRVIAEGTVGGLAAEMQGGEFGQGFLLSSSLSSLTWASLEMRETMIEQSRLVSENTTGNSAGFRGDRFKLGGSRFPSEGSLLGGKQGGPGGFFGIKYKPGSFLDLLVETYAGPHDFLNSPLLYNEVGNSANRWVGLEAINAANVLVATPFAAASVIPSFAYGAVSD